MAINIQAELSRIEATLPSGAARVRACKELVRQVKLEKARQPVQLWERSTSSAPPVAPVTKQASTSAWEEIEQLAKGKVSKGLCTSFAQALQAVCTERPDLYATYSHQQSFVAKGLPEAPGTEVERLQALAAELVRKGQASPGEAFRKALETPEGQALSQAYYAANPHLRG